MNTERNLRRTVLPNGLIVLTERMDHLHSVAMGIWIKSGSRCETPEINGISHFVEHMLFKGTRSRSAQRIAREMDSIGGNLDAFTSKETICFNVKSLADHVPIALDVLTDMVLNPDLCPARHRARARGDSGRDQDRRRQSRRAGARAVHAELLEGASAGQADPGHHGNRGAAGPAAALRLPRRPFSRREYGVLRGRKPGPRPVCRGRGGKVLGAGRRRTLHELSAPEPSARIILRNKKALEQVQICLGVPAPPITDENRYATLILNTVLGGGMSSRLFQTIREERGLAYSIYSDLSPYRDTGNLCVYAGTSANKALEVVDLILAEFRNLKRDADRRRGADARQGPGEGQHSDGAGKLRTRAWRTWRGRRCTSTSSSRPTRLLRA